MNVMSDLTILEREVLLKFLREHINQDNLSTLTSSVIRHLFLAYIKLEKEQMYAEEALAYTE